MLKATGGGGIELASLEGAGIFMQRVFNMVFPGGTVPKLGCEVLSFRIGGNPFSENTYRWCFF